MALGDAYGASTKTGSDNVSNHSQRRSFLLASQHQPGVRNGLEKMRTAYEIRVVARRLNTETHCQYYLRTL